MTEHNVAVAFAAHDQNISRLAWRTAAYTRMSHKHLPKTEDAIFRKAAIAKRQTLAEQFAMAKLITKVMH